MSRQIRLILNSYILLLLFPVTLFAQSSDDMHSRANSVEVAQKYKDLFVDALVQRVALNVSPQADEPPVTDQTMLEVWSGNQPDIDAALTDILLKFERRHTLRKRNEFFLSVRFDGDYLFVRSTLPAGRELAAGVKLPLKSKESKSVLMQGLDLSGIVVAVPRIADSGLRGALFCPKDFVREAGVIKSTVLVDTGFRVASVQLNARAHGEGRVLTGSNVGMAKVNIATSSNIPNPASYYDVSYTKDPRVSVNYLPIDEPPIIKVSESGSLLEGIEVMIELQTAAGFKRKTLLVESLLIEPFSRDIDLPIKFLKRDFVVKAQDCVMLLQRRSLEHTYTKEALESPHKK